MANVSRTVDVIFNGKDAMSPAVNNILKNLKTLNRAADRTVEKVAKLSKGFEKTTAAVTGLAAVLGTYAKIKFKNFESVWLDLVKITEGGEAALVGVEEEVKALADRFGVSMTEITQSVIDFKRAGIDLTDSLKMVGHGLDLASAGNVEMAVSTQYLIQIMKGFRFETEQISHVVDVVNIVSDKYATTVEELGRALARAAPSAKQAGLSIEELTAVATPIIEIFQSGEEAGTALRRGLIKLTDDAAPVKRALSELGISQKDANGELRRGREILYDMAAAFDENISAQKKLALVAEIFGQRQGAKMVALFEDWNYVMGIKNVAAGVAAQYTIDQVETKLRALDVRLKRTNVALEYFGVVLGRKLKPGTAAALSGVADALAEMSDAVKTEILEGLFEHFTVLGERLGEYFRDVGEAFPEAIKGIDYSGLIRAFDDLVNSINSVFKGLDLRKPEDLAKALQFIIDSLESGIEIAAGMIDVFGDVAYALGGAISGFNTLDSTQKRIVGGILATFRTMEKFGKALGLYISQAENVAATAESTLTRVGGLAKLISSELGYFKTTFVEFILEIGRAITWTLGLFSKTARKEYELLTEAERLAEEEGKRYAQEMTQGYNRLVKGIEHVIAKTGEAENAVEKLNETTQEIPKLPAIDPEIEKVAAGIQRVWDRPRKVMEAMTGSIKEQIEEIGEAELAVPDDKKFEAAQRKILEEIKANADIMQEQFKTVAVSIEADANRVNTAFESIGGSVSDTGDLIGELYQQLSTRDIDFVTRYNIERQIQTENRRREEAFELQKSLTEAQLDLIERRSAAIEAGNPIVTVSGDGLQPHLESIMWEIFSAIQVRVNEDYDNFLFGLRGAI